MRRFIRVQAVTAPFAKEQFYYVNPQHIALVSAGEKYLDRETALINMADSNQSIYVYHSAEEVVALVENLP